MADKMVYSDNPYIDILVHYTKLMTIESIVKDEAEADLNETIESRNASLIYVNNTLKNRYVDYEEKNSYYRLLGGLPPIPTQDEQIRYISENPNKDPLKMYWVPIAEYKYILDDADISIEGEYPEYLHMVSSTLFASMEILGIIDFIKLDPRYSGDKFKYIDHLGNKKIDPLTARTTDRFQLMYLPDVEYSIIKQSYEYIYEKNRLYVMRCVYSDAFKLGNKYYDKFIIILIKVITMMDMIVEVYNHLIHTEIFDSRTIRFLFESYGVDYYSEIPTKYQVAMIKNMNTLLKYKSTNRNIVDICSLFGCDNIEVFKYYIMKERTVGELHFKEDGTEDYTKNYSLKFIKVPLQESLDDYIQSLEHRVPYEDITSQDPFWYGLDATDLKNLNYDDINRFIAKRKREILEKEFSYERTKYISIDSTYDLAKMSQQISYFYNMIFDTIADDIKLSIPRLSRNEIDLGHLFCYILALGYIYNGIEDDIITNDMEKNMYIYGFNFEEDMSTLYTNLSDDFNIDTAKDDFLTELLGGNKFLYQNDVSLDEKLPYQKFLEVFENNLKIEEYLREVLIEESDKDAYDLYELLYKSLVTKKFSTDYFKDAEGYIPRTYTEFLNNKNPDLYKSIEECRSIDNDERRKETISDILDIVVYTLEDMFETFDFSYIYNIVPTRNLNFLTQCVIKVINFFKSYKTQMVGISTIYKIDDKLDNKISFLEKILMSDHYDFYDKIEPHDTSKVFSRIVIKDKIGIIDDVEEYLDEKIDRDDFVVAPDLNGLTLVSCRTTSDKDITLFTEYPDGDVTRIDSKGLQELNFNSIIIPEGIEEIM